MAENLQDEILAFGDNKVYDIANPVTVTRWEIKQVSGLNKQYLQVYFQKLVNDIKAFQLNIACYSAFGNEEKTLSGISIQDVDKKGVEFSEVIPLNSDIRKVEVYLSQCLLTDGTTLKVKERRIVENSFVPFEKEDRAAAQSLLPNTKGYPIEKGTHWFCACGAVYSSEHDNCIKCGKSKKEIFTLITSDEVEEEKERFVQQTRANKRKKKKFITVISSVISGVVAFLVILIIVLCYTVIPLRTIKINGLTFGKTSGSPPNHYWIDQYNGNKKDIAIPSNLRGLAVCGAPFIKGVVSVETITISAGMPECSSHTVAKHYDELLVDLNKGCKNLKKIYIEDEFPSGMDRFYSSIGSIEIIWGYRG